MNVAIVAGFLTADARVTELPDGSTVHNFEIRSTHDGDRSVVPVAWYGARRPPKLVAGGEVVVCGVVRRRWFRAGGGSQSRTEVVASAVAKVGSKAVARMLAEAVEQVVFVEVSPRPAGE